MTATTKPLFKIGDRVLCRGKETILIGTIQAMPNRYYCSVFFSNGSTMDVSRSLMEFIQEPSELLKELL